MSIPLASLWHRFFPLAPKDFLRQVLAAAPGELERVRIHVAQEQEGGELECSIEYEALAAGRVILRAREALGTTEMRAALRGVDSDIPPDIETAVRRRVTTRVEDARTRIRAHHIDVEVDAA